MITDEQKGLILQQYYDRGVLNKEIRSYEVSLWTLQDDFMTVLKWSDVEQKGRIEDPKLTINVDGTQKFTFSIPMYYRVNGKLIENPNWYNVQQGLLIMGLRKIKIIFNKGEEFNIEDEEMRAKVRSSNVFELLITKVTDTHEEDRLICSVECEGLAFHELGKVGYKVNLSQDNFLLDKAEWDECASTPKYWTKRNGEQCFEEPVQTVQYWCEQCDLERVPDDETLMQSNKWYYTIQMNWGSFGYSSDRSPEKVYEEEYISSWTNNLAPNTIEEYREKYRPVEASESNLYNITQNIAETFEIYCRYEYGYDDNYHIISRRIIFYNNYMDENNVISFTYPYITKQVSREMDATEVTTKMFVRPQDSEAVVSGQINIADCLANKTKEDYLLNFDYLRTIGAITREQYEEIPKFEVKVRNLNIELNELNLQLAALNKLKTEQEALAAIHKNSIALDQESIDYNTALYKRLDSSDKLVDGYFTRGPAHPYQTYIRQDANGRYYISLSTEDKGIRLDRLLVFRSYSSTQLTFKNQISNYTVVYDEFGEPKELTLASNFDPVFVLDSTSISLNTDTWITTTVSDKYPASTVPRDTMTVSLVYKYQPKLYYDKVNEIWVNKLTNDKRDYETANNIATQAAEDIVELEKEYNTKLAEKTNLIANFTALMGPALREGYWQPEDYKDYGDNKVSTDSLGNIYNSVALINDTGRDIAASWDATLFEDEDTLYYEYGALREKIYYPCVLLNSTLMSKISAWLNSNKSISFIFNNNYYKTLTEEERMLVQNLSSFTLGSTMQFGFIASNQDTTIKPVLILTGAKSMTDEEIEFMRDGGRPQLGVATAEVVNSIAKLSIETGAVNVSNQIFIPNSNQFIVYPRIKISSNELNTSSIVLRYNGILLEDFVDYQILSRTTTRFNKAYFEYFITIKPNILFKVGDYTQSFEMAYTLSNAATCMYLDAQQVMQDSSKPRASYTVSLNIVNADYLKTLYRNLTQLVMINDVELKFNNVFGYISQLELDLDHPWLDVIEVKNYKTKFEDLFTTIVASSETMRQNAAAYDAAAQGLIPLKEDALIKMINDNQSLLNLYFDAGFDGSAHVRAMLADIFTEAGAILASSNSALNDVRQLTLRNAEILQGFVENIAGELTPNVIASQEQPIDFKVGDIWNKTDARGNIIGRYVATAGSDDSADGFTRTFDGSLASIKGASLNVDAVAGTINIEAENRIDMKSGGNIYIAANEKIDMVGNKAVNIGGGTINIAGSTNDIDGNSTGYTSGGINIVSAGLNFNKNASTSIEQQVENAVADTTGSISKVLIHPDKIELGSANIIMRGANKIQIITSRNTLSSTSAISLSPADGIWIGSGAGVRLYSGNVELTEEADHTFTPVSGSGANVELMPDHLLFGVSNMSDATTAIKMTTDYIVMGAGDAINGSGADGKIALGIIGNSSGLIGAKFTKDSIGFATSANGVVNAILMNNNGITVGSGSNLDLRKSKGELRTSGGSYVRIAADGIDIGSLSHLYVNTTNFKINSAATGNEIMMGLYYNNGATRALEYTQNSGLYVHGSIINDQMAFINGTYTINGQNKQSGIYLTNSSISGSPISITYNGIIYYAWQQNGKTYYCTSNSGTSHTINDSETLLTYESTLKGVSPKYARTSEQVAVYDGTDLLYTYIQYYITTNGSTPLIVNNNKVIYDGSNAPNAAWYNTIPTAQRSAYANEYYSENTTLTQVTGTKRSALTNTTLTRSLDVTFSIEAMTGLTTIKAGSLGNFYVSPQGLSGGTIAGSNIQNTNITGCAIETYNTGYYGRCFYDYAMNRDTGILVLKRIDGTQEVIDIKTTAEVVSTGTSTGDTTSTDTGGGEVSGCSTCDSTCTGSCQGECVNTCKQYCTVKCGGGCSGTCGDNCNKGCAVECSTGCSAGCGSACSVACTGGCSGNCGDSCSEDCTTDCASVCYGTCGGGCSDGCSGTCKNTCQEYCTTSCRRDCASSCYATCGNSMAIQDN